MCMLCPLQERVRKDLAAWLSFLRRNVGFDGWRFDYVKGYCASWITLIAYAHALMTAAWPE